MEKIEKLTKEQEAAIPAYRDMWIKKGLQTGETDWDTFDKYMPICYEKAGLKYPTRVVRVNSPLVGGLASSIASRILNKEKGAVREAVGGAVDEAVVRAVRGAVREAVVGAVDEAVGVAVGVAVRVAVRGAVDEAVVGAVREAVRETVDEAVVRAVREAVRETVGEAKLNWHYWLGGQFWVGGWYWGASFVNFFFDVCKLELSKDIMERAEAYRKVCESVNYIWPNTDFVMVCARPIKITRNNQGRLHSDTEKAIEYPDSWGLYLLNGVRFSEELWTKVVSKKMPFEEILAIKDIDQRTQAMKYGDIAEFLKHTKSELLSSKRIHRTKYELWKTPKEAEIFTVDAYHCVYKDPATNLTYMSGVAPEIGVKGDVVEAMGWKRNMSGEEFLEAIYK